MICSMALIKIKKFNSRLEAEVAKSYLASVGIEAQIQTDDLGGMRPALAFSDGANLLVLQIDAVKALQILTEIE